MAWAPDYVDADDLKAWDRIESGDVVDDAEYAQAATAGCRAVDGAAGRQFGQVDAPESRLFTARWDAYTCTYIAVIDDLQDVTGLVVTGPAGLAVDAGDYRLLPLNAAAKGRPYERIRVPAAGEYELFGLFGWSAVPEPVKLAAKMQGARFIARRDAAFGVAGSPQDGSEVRLLAKVDPDVEVILRRGKYVRNWWAV